MGSNQETPQGLEMSMSENGVTAGNDNSPATAEGNEVPLRQGTISSARFNLLCTMVGGGCLSLPLAFQKTGNGFFAPIMLIITAVITEFCFRLIVASIRKLSPVRENTNIIGRDSFETMFSAAFGTQGFVFAKWLVTAMCFFGAVGYAVLLRDMLQPITDAITHKTHHHDAVLGSWLVNDWGVDEGAEPGAGPSLASNLTMLTVILIITPVCTLQNLSSLEKLGAASMSAILILGACIAFRSLQCNLGHPNESFDGHVWKAFKWWPDSAKDVLDAFPLYVSCYVCHYNVPAVHNELQNPSPKRVNYWLRSTTVSATMFYMVMGLAGSAYGHCTPTGKVQGNVLLDFDESDPLLLVARMCLACTITLAFPLLVIPARDILLRSWFDTTEIVVEPTLQQPAIINSDPDTSNEVSLQEPLLSNNEMNENVGDAEDGNNAPSSAAATEENTQQQPEQHSFALRLALAILVLWTAAGVACCVKSIDIVWDLLGSSLSILLSYLIPCASFIAVLGSATENNDDDDDEEATGTSRETALWIAKGLVLLYVPLMIISTGNAFVDTFLH